MRVLADTSPIDVHFESRGRHLHLRGTAPISTRLVLHMLRLSWIEVACSWYHRSCEMEWPFPTSQCYQSSTYYTPNVLLPPLYLNAKAYQVSLLGKPLRPRCCILGEGQRRNILEGLGSVDRQADALRFAKFA